MEHGWWRFPATLVINSIGSAPLPGTISGTYNENGGSQTIVGRYISDNHYLDFMRIRDAGDPNRNQHFIGYAYLLNERAQTGPNNPAQLAGTFSTYTDDELYHGWSAEKK